MNPGSASSTLQHNDNMPAGLLILSPDLRICFANQTYLHGALQGPQEVLGWKVRDVVSAEGIEDLAKAILDCSDRAASCCFDTFIHTDLAGERPVHITMTRIAPWQGEERVLVVVEDLLPGSFLRSDLPVEGYVC